MLGICFFVLILVSFLAAAAGGNMASLTNAVLDGAANAVQLTISLAGMTALWCGVMNVLREAGAIRHLSRLLAPVLRCIFPDAWKKNIACEEITAAVSANLLGIGNAATPLALAAMKKMDEANGQKESATDDMVMLAVLATASFNLMPTTLIALRRAVGSAAPYAILVPVWIASGVCAISAVLLCRLAAWRNVRAG